MRLSLIRNRLLVGLRLSRRCCIRSRRARLHDELEDFKGVWVLRGGCRYTEVVTSRKRDLGRVRTLGWMAKQFEVPCLLRSKAYHLQ
jgi:hypothetical protein